MNQSGWYWVDLKDQLGFRTRDSVQVSYPGNLQLPHDSIICLGESFNWDLELDNSYSVSWTNGQESSAIEQFNELILSATITDQNSCETMTNELNLVVDSLDALLSIGEIEDLCEGNVLMPTAGEQDLLNAIWNDTDEQEFFEVNQSGEVWVELTDENGCIGRDTLNVNIIGAAPQLEITMPDVRCNSVEFIIDAQIETPDSVDDISWTINNEEVGNTETLTFFTENPESVTIDLYVSTSVGCFNQVSETFEVFETPELGFNSGLNCAFSTSQWVANSTLEMTDLQSINWQYNGDSYSGIVVNPELAESGFSDLTIKRY